MIMKKGFHVFVAIFIIVSSNECTACFTENKHEEHTSKTGSKFIKNCICEKDGYSVEHLTWVDPNGQPIKPNGPGTSSIANVYTDVQPQNGIVSLVVGSISPAMSGSYVCMTNFEGNTYTKTYKIEAYDDLYFVNTSDHQNAIIGEDSLIRCEVRRTTNHAVSVAWYRFNGSETVLLDDKDKYNFIANQGLLIKNVSKDDDGRYICAASYISEADTEEITIDVQVAVRPVIADIRLNIPLEKDIVAGEKVIVECIAEGLPYPTYTWIKVADSLAKPVANGNATWTQNINALVFESIQKEDAGTYVCIADNIVDNATREIFIAVNVPPVITFLDNVTAVEGSQTQIACKASGVPAPRILMWHSVEGLDEDGRISLEVKNATDASELYLSIVNVSREFEGIYLCSAENSVVNITQEMYLTVLFPPYFHHLEETMWGWTGKTINMSCDHESNPPSTIVWKFQGNEIEHETTTAEHVQVNKLLEEQQANTTSARYLALIVDNSTMYGDYECTASNDYGKTTKRIHLREAFKPEAVRNVTVINTSATSVTFLIQGPDASENAPVHGYTAEYDVIDNYNITSVHLTRTCSLDRNFTIDRLRPNSTYLIKFAAQNEVGVGAWSEAIEFETPETSAPEPPMLHVQGNQGKLRWRAPEANGDPIDHYSVEFCPVSADFMLRGVTTGGAFVTYLYTVAIRYIGAVDCTKNCADFCGGMRKQHMQKVTNRYSVITLAHVNKKQTPAHFHTNVFGRGFFGQVINTTLCQKETVSATEFELDKLDRNTKYSFEIRAHNSHGYSDFTYEEIKTPEKLVGVAVLSAGAIIGIAVVVVFLCLLVLDLLLLCWRRQGIIASCYFRKNKKKKADNLQSRDKKGLLVREGDNSLTRPDNGHRELVYNKTTGVITGKHSTV